MIIIDICAHEQGWEVNVDGWYQGTFKSLTDAYESASLLSNERGDTEIVVHENTDNSQQSRTADVLIDAEPRRSRLQ